MTDLDELSRLLEQATPGPWELGKEGGGFWRRGYRPINAPDHHAVVEAVVRMEGEDANDPQLEANAALIAALRNAAEELVRDARRMEWAEKHMNAIDTVSHPDNLVMIWHGPHETSAAGRTLRAAIDAAIAQEGKPCA
jgi:hypothetical protein